MTKIIVGAFCGFAFLLAGSVFAQDVKVDYDKAFDFNTLKTFSIKIGTSWGNPISEKRALGEFEAALIKKGWTKAEEADANATVVLHGASQQKKDLNTFYSGYGGGYRWGGFGGMGTATTTVSEYTVGTLLVDIFDAKTKDLVFRGVAQAELSDKPEKNQKKLTKACEKMFKDFPPQPKKK
ncbi:MAG TPA: DUF4136 domain-containing protein [Acidobacteriota bacterium]|nr:DUF4136 domain-containing protein [Acidobacteriota bacterium]